MGSESSGKFKGVWPVKPCLFGRSRKRRITAVVLGSGGARGWAHVGVLKAFREVGFKPDIVAGSSIGAVAAAIYAVDALDDLLKFSEDFHWLKATQLFLEFGVHRSGFTEGRKVTDFLESIIKVKNIEEMSIPFAAVATDLLTSEEVVFKRGPLIQALRSSISIPGVFTPVHFGTRFLIDGGLVNPLPMNVAREMGATHVVAVNINNNNNLKAENSEEGGTTTKHSPVSHRHFLNLNADDTDEDKAEEEGTNETVAGDNAEAPADAEEDSGFMKRLWGRHRKHEKSLDMNLFDVFTRSLRIAEDKITAECIRNNPPDVLIEPAVGDIATMDFSRSADVIKAGYDAAMAAFR